jgi:hypothetical protein
MSFVPPTPPLDGELAQAREEELELKAEEYARTHPDGQEDERPPRPRIFARLLRALRSRRI